jgi:palmitoyltransferase ZDHHC9/14/18
MTGPKKTALRAWIVWAVIGLHTALYFAFIAPYLWTQFSPVLPILSAFLNLVCYVATFVVCFSDPGVLPRKSLCEVGAVFPEDAEALLNPESGSRCYTCEIFRPARAHHCRVCDNCVELFDHHCDYVNNCIGANNYKYFIAFLATFICMALSDICGLLLFITFKTGLSKH